MFIYLQYIYNHDIKNIYKPHTDKEISEIKGKKNLRSERYWLLQTTSFLEAADIRACKFST